MAASSKTTWATGESLTAADVNRIETGLGVSAPYVPAPRAKNASVITNFQSGHGFANQNAAPQADDTADFVIGSQSLKLTTDGVAGVNSTRKSSISPVIDLTNKQLKITLKVSDATQIADLMIYVSSDNMATSANVRIAPSTVPSTKFITSGDWVTITLSKGDFTGSVTWSAINAIQLRAKDRGTGSFSVNWGQIATMAAPANGVVSLTFDDGLVSQYTDARRILDSAGFPATAYLIRDRIGQSGFMTQAQVDALREFNGWEIAAHADTITDHDARFSTLTEAVTEADFRALRKWLNDNGYRGVDHFAYPGGEFTNTVLKVMKRTFASGRTIYGASSTGNAWSETYPPADPYKLRCWSVINTDTTANIQAAVDRAIANNHWLILCFHKIVAAPSASTEYSTANFQTVVDYLRTSGAKVKTVGDVLRNGVS